MTVKPRRLANLIRRLSSGMLLTGLTLLSSFYPVGAPAEIYQYIGPNGTISLTNVPSDARYRRVDVESARFHALLSERELEPVI